MKSFYDLVDKNTDLWNPEKLTSDWTNENLELVEFVVYSSPSTDLYVDWKYFNRSGDLQWRDDGNIILNWHSWMPFSLEVEKAHIEYNKVLFSTLEWKTKFKYSFWKTWKLLLDIYQKEIYAIPKPIEGIYLRYWDVAVEREITNCSNKAIFVDDEHKIDTDFEYLSRHYNYERFFKGNQSLFSDFVTWQFDNPRGSKLPYIFGKILESGIYHQIEWFYNRQKYSGIRLNYTRSKVQTNYEPVRPLDLYSNINTIFYLFLVGIAVSISAIVVEIMIKILVLKCISKFRLGLKSFTNLGTFLKTKLRKFFRRSQKVTVMIVRPCQDGLVLKSKVICYDFIR